MLRCRWTTSLLCGLLVAPVLAAPDSMRDRAAAALERATAFYRTQVTSHGGYVYYYSLDLARRWGEGEATRDQIWVQPPGTPTVGLAYLRAYAATGQAAHLAAARQAAEALVYGQLASGGWTNCVDFNPRGERVAKYRNGRGGGKDNSTLDDGITQGALRLLMRVDQAQGFAPGPIHDAATSGLAALLAAQFPNGAFPQVWTKPVTPQPIVKPSFPAYDWTTKGRIKDYWDMYTLNDNVAVNVAQLLLDAAEVYGPQPYRDRLARLGDFLILAQMPDPQPAWAQQYSYAMHPIWARAFEPPAISGGESQGVMETLLRLYQVTGEARYLAPIPRALAYFRRSLLPDGRLARYYALQTNRPLYMKRTGDRYHLTYDDRDLPDHYGWKIPSRLDAIEQRYRDVQADRTPDYDRLSDAALEAEVARIVADLDAVGRWVSTYAGGLIVGQPKWPVGQRYLSSEVFSRNVELLSEYLIRTK